MKLFKNGIGRPSNETKRKRKIFYIAIIIATILLIGGASLVIYFYTNGIIGSSKNATTNNCQMPYTYSKCKSVKNTTVKKVQEMLKSIKYYDGEITGVFGKKTQASVIKFQKKLKLNSDGNVGPTTLEALAKVTKTDYFKVKYDKNGGSGTLNSQYNNVQTIIRGISTKTSTTKLKKSGKTHVGYTATTKINGETYAYGCFNANCVSGNQKKYSATEIKKRTANGEKFYYYVCPIGISLKNTGTNGQVINFKAAYCSSNQKYDQKTSKCVKVTSTATNASYNIQGQLTGYNGNCYGCSGLTACNGYNVIKNLTYPDKTYGDVRVVAMSRDYDCGTIIEIQSLYEGKTKKAVKAVVLDRGGAITGNKIDLLSLESSDYIYENIGSQSVKFKVLRKGW